MDLRQLRYFMTVASERSFTRAAELLNMAQPPLSRQISQLEDELGVRLLDRGRPVAPTEAGRYLFEQARQILARVDEVAAMTRRIGAGRAAPFTIGFVASTLYEVLPDLIRRFRAEEPGIAVELVEMTTLEQGAALREGRIDVGFGRLTIAAPGIARRVIRREALSAAVPPDHPLAASSAPVRLAALAGEPLILYPNAPRPSYADQVLALFRDRGMEPVVGAEVREVQTALGLVAAAAGISLVPASVARFGRDDVRFRPLADPDATSPIVMSHRAGDTSALLGRFVALVAATATSDDADLR